MMNKSDITEIATNVITIITDEMGVKPSVDLDGLEKAIIKSKPDIDKNGGVSISNNEFITEYADKLGVQPHELEDIINEEIYSYTGVYMNEGTDVSDVSPIPLERLPTLETYKKDKNL